MKTIFALILAILALASFTHCNKAQAPLPLRARLAAHSYSYNTEIYGTCKRQVTFRAAGTIPPPGGCPSGTNYEDGLCYPPTPGYDCLALNCYKHCGGQAPVTCYLHMCATYTANCAGAAAYYLKRDWCD